MADELIERLAAQAREDKERESRELDPRWRSLVRDTLSADDAAAL